ncbi:ubiquitin-protein ligase E3 [Schizosaccharomyces japonicus yFS275]|uniref:Ubiquitin-protein ligase E3 n=1 Tax=Schizosaccharomyces japonicus (strain yFS275 / FY16936) TaxID=402676 RepID=B6K1C6_SCHJY|nr:ubiquitin-protein ligase E3 [Schizosaccharomyces japonicus yFS275]EEB07747.1 ubiquitin-protein ligase E3 [Schizosaccharomyces japonicus yFS275]
MATATPNLQLPSLSLECFVCKKCNSLMTNPVTLPCGGSVCRTCFSALFPTVRNPKTHVQCIFGHNEPHYSVETNVRDILLTRICDIIREGITPKKHLQSSLGNVGTSISAITEADTGADAENEGSYEHDLLDGFSNSLSPIKQASEFCRGRQTKLKDAITAELDCQICYAMLYEPITTPCGHSFCDPCLMQALSQSARCPACRAVLPSPAVLEHAHNRPLCAFIRETYPEHWLERRKCWEEEKEQESWMPLFVCMVAYPHMSTFLHIFEPRYKIMLERCMEGTKRFCITMPLQVSKRRAQNEQPRELRNARGQRLFCAQYGTVMEILTAEQLPDGRSLVEARGTCRFKILDFQSDGLYPMVKVEKRFDTPTRTSPLQFPLPEQWLQHANKSTEQLVEEIDIFYTNARNTCVHWVVPLLDIRYEAATLLSDLSFKVASLLPIPEFEKTRILEIDNPDDRLILILIWLQWLQNTWWYRLSNTCTLS